MSNGSGRSASPPQCDQDCPPRCWFQTVGDFAARAGPAYFLVFRAGLSESRLATVRSATSAPHHYWSSSAPCWGREWGGGLGASSSPKRWESLLPCYGHITPECKMECKHFRKSLIHIMKQAYTSIWTRYKPAPQRASSRFRADTTVQPLHLVVFPGGNHKSIFWARIPGLEPVNFTQSMAYALRCGLRNLIPHRETMESMTYDHFSYRGMGFHEILSSGCRTQPCGLSHIRINDLRWRPNRGQKFFGSGATVSHRPRARVRLPMPSPVNIPPLRVGCALLRSQQAAPSVTRPGFDPPRWCRS